MVSLDELNVKVEDHSRANATLLEENRTLREEYKEKIARFHEQALASKEIIAKLSEMNVRIQWRCDVVIIWKTGEWTNISSASDVNQSKRRGGIEENNIRLYRPCEKAKWSHLQSKGPSR